MTNSNDRIDRIEAALLRTQRQIDEGFQRTQRQIDEGFQRTQRQIDEGFQRTQQQIDSNARAIQANSESVTVVAEAAGRTLRAVDELREIVEEDRVNFREHLERTDTAIASINATLAVLQQLMRDRDGNGDQPQA